MQLRGLRCRMMLAGRALVGRVAVRARAWCVLAWCVLAGAGCGGDVAPEAAWQRAQAHLAAGRPAEAVYWLERAAHAGYGPAHHALGDARRTGVLRDTTGTPRALPLPRDTAAATRRYRRAARAYRAALADTSATNAPARAAARRAQTALGELRLLGHGAPPDTARALALWRPAARAGHAEAAYRLGTLHFDARHPRHAVRWLRRAARAGHPAAQTLLAVCYQDGHGVPARLDSARVWLRRAAAQGDSTAVHQLRALDAHPKSAP